MNYFEIILLVIILALGFLVWVLMKKKKESEKEGAFLVKEKDEYLELGRGLTEYNQKLQDKKRLAKEKVLELFKNKAKVSHSQLAEVLNISRTTTVRYLDELEKEGKIKQIGKVGQKVYYISKTE